MKTPGIRRVAAALTMVIFSGCCVEYTVQPARIGHGMLVAGPHPQPFTRRRVDWTVGNAGPRLWSGFDPCGSFEHMYPDHLLGYRPESSLADTQASLDRIRSAIHRNGCRSCGNCAAGCRQCEPTNSSSCCAAGSPQVASDGKLKTKEGNADSAAVDDNADSVVQVDEDMSAINPADDTLILSDIAPQIPDDGYDFSDVQTDQSVGDIANSPGSVSGSVTNPALAGNVDKSAQNAGRSSVAATKRQGAVGDSESVAADGGDAKTRPDDAAPVKVANPDERESTTPVKLDVTKTVVEQKTRPPRNVLPDDAAPILPTER